MEVFVDRISASVGITDVLDILNHADTALSDLETTLTGWSTLEPTNQQTQDVLARVDKLIQTLQTVREKLPEEVRPHLDSAIQNLQDLRKKLPAIWSRPTRKPRPHFALCRNYWALPPAA